jgi:hypothetical protein
LEAVTCPGCGKSIRVPADVLGQTAKCPFCKCHFKAPVRTPEGLTDPVLMRRNVFGRNKTVLPATLMLMVGLIGVVNNGAVALQSLIDPEVFEANTRNFFEQLASRAQDDEQRDAIRAKIPAALRWGPVVRTGFAALALASVAGAVGMLRKRVYSLAVFAGFATMFNMALPSCCCVLGILIGGYSLYVLMDPEVRAEFRSPKPATP